MSVPAPVKIDREDWVVVRPKFVRYKLGITRFYNPSTKRHYHTPKYLFAQDTGPTLRLFELRKDVPVLDEFIISCRHDSLNVYHVNKRNNRKVIRNVSPRFTTIADNLFNKPKYLWFKKKEVSRRINKITANFLKRNGYKVKRGASFTEMIYKNMYPALRDCKIEGLFKLGSDYSIHFRRDTLKDAIKGCFGNSGRLITKAVCESFAKDKNFNICTIGATLKNRVAVDDIIKQLNAYHGGFKPDHVYHRSYGIDARNINKFLKLFSRERVMRLIQDAPRDIVSDTLKMYDRDKDKLTIPEKPESFDEIHDAFVAQLDKINNPSVPFEYDAKTLERYDNVTIGDMVCKLPKDNHELKQWGRDMHNCVGSYDWTIRDKSVIILGIFREGKIIYNVSISGRTVEQFYGPCNQPPNEIDRGLFMQYIFDNTNVIAVL